MKGQSTLEGVSCLSDLQLGQLVCSSFSGRPQALTSLSASEENPLALCVHSKDGQYVCETDRCRMQACQRAAEEGHAKAILLIGVAHVYGKGVSKDYVRAYMYFQVLHHVRDTPDKRQRHEGREYSQRLMNELKEGMAPGDISRAGTLAREWIDENLRKTRQKK